MQVIYNHAVAGKKHRLLPRFLVHHLPVFQARHESLLTACLLSTSAIQAAYIKVALLPTLRIQMYTISDTGEHNLRAGRVVYVVERLTHSFRLSGLQSLRTSTNYLFNEEINVITRAVTNFSLSQVFGKCLKALCRLVTAGDFIRAKSGYYVLWIVQVVTRY